MPRGAGKKCWVFADGDLPPAGDREPFGHEALMITNTGTAEADVEIEILFEEREPIRGIRLKVGGERVRCLRLDKPIGDQRYSIPHGQYALVLRSTVPVVAVFGRLDVRQDNLAYYSVQGFSV
jgi:hypothetical protein